MDIREYLQKYCINKTQFAKKAGVPLCVLWRAIYETPISIENAKKISKATEELVLITSLVRKQ